MKTTPAAMAAQTLLEMALRLDASPMANTSGKPLTRINASIAMTCLLIAASNLDGAKPGIMERLRATAAPHAMALEPEHRHTADGPGQTCLAASDSNGHVCYNCVFDEKSQICLNCPHLAGALPIPEDILNLPHNPALAPAARPPDLLQAQQDTLDIIHLTATLSPHIAALPRQEQRAAAAIAAAEAVYYILSALERSTCDREPQTWSKAAQAYEEAAELLYQAMGAPPPSPHTTPHDACYAMHWHYQDHPARTEYACRDPEDDKEERPDRCDRCPLHRHPPRPMPWELIKRPATRGVQ